MSEICMYCEGDGITLDMLCCDKCNGAGYIEKNPKIYTQAEMDDALRIVTEERNQLLRVVELHRDEIDNFPKFISNALIDAQDAFDILLDAALQPYREAMQEFVDRCDKGEVRSNCTYCKFKNILSASIDTVERK